MQLTSEAAELFREQNGHEQRRLLRTLVKNASWQAGELRLEFVEPFEILRGSNLANRRKEMREAGSGRDSEIWLTSRDSNLFTFRLTACTVVDDDYLTTPVISRGKLLGH